MFFFFALPLALNPTDPRRLDLLKELRDLAVRRSRSVVEMLGHLEAGGTHGESWRGIGKTYEKNGKKMMKHYDFRR